MRFLDVASMMRHEIMRVLHWLSLYDVITPLSKRITKLFFVDVLLFEPYLKLSWLSQVSLLYKTVTRMHSFIHPSTHSFRHTYKHKYWYWYEKKIITKKLLKIVQFVWNNIDLSVLPLIILQTFVSIVFSEAAEKLFDLVDNFAESAKRKAAVWPLQIILLILCPEITHTISKDTVEDSKANKVGDWDDKRTHAKNAHIDTLELTLLPVFWLCQKLFLDSLRKALAGQGGSKQLMESAAIACVKLCKASTYINWEDHSTIFLLVQSIVMDLKVIITSMSISHILSVTCNNVGYNLRNVFISHLSLCISPTEAKVLEYIQSCFMISLWCVGFFRAWAKNITIYAILDQFSLHLCDMNDTTKELWTGSSQKLSNIQEHWLLWCHTSILLSLWLISLNSSSAHWQPHTWQGSLLVGWVKLYWFWQWGNGPDAIWKLIEMKKKNWT